MFHRKFTTKTNAFLVRWPGQPDKTLGRTSFSHTLVTSLIGKFYTRFRSPHVVGDERDDKDDQITKQVKDRLSKDPDLKNADINVRTDAKVVTLTGKVPDIMLSVSASEIARAVPGVDSVRNDLSVVSTALKDFQKKEGPQVTGRLNAETQARLERRSGM